MIRHTVAATVVVVVATVGVALPATAGAQSDWPPADKQEYVDSGRYLADVQVAAAPAMAWLVSRTDQIAADRRACIAAGLPFPAPVAPAAARSAQSSAPAAGPLRDGATVRSTALHAAARPGGVAAVPRASAPAWDGATTIVPDRRATAVRRLRRAGVGLSGSSAAIASWSRVLLRSSSVSFSGPTLVVAHRGTLRLRAGGRAVRLRGVRLTATPAGRVRVSALVGRYRATLLTGTAPKAGRSIAKGATLVQVPATRLRLSAAGARRLRTALGARTLRPGAFGTLSLRATRRPAGGPGGPATPAPGTPDPDGTAPVTAAPATAASCAAIPARPAVVLDIDETALSNYLGTFGDPEGGSAGYAAVSVFGAGTALQPVFDIYAEARRRGVAVFFITARPGIIEPSTVANLRRVGYTAWDGLTFKNDLASEKDVHKTAERRKVQDAGYRIVLNVGDQQTDIDGGYAERAFKLPNPFY